MPGASPSGSICRSRSSTSAAVATTRMRAPAHVIGDIVGKDCLLVDDEIATGGTIFSATEFLLERGAARVSAAIIHPVLSGRAIERLDRFALAAPARHQHDPDPRREALRQDRSAVAGAAARDGHHAHPRRPHPSPSSSRNIGAPSAGPGHARRPQAGAARSAGATATSTNRDGDEHEPRRPRARTATATSADDTPPHAGAAAERSRRLSSIGPRSLKCAADWPVAAGRAALCRRRRGLLERRGQPRPTGPAVYPRALRAVAAHRPAFDVVLHVAPPPLEMLPVGRELHEAVAVRARHRADPR